MNSSKVLTNFCTLLDFLLVKEGELQAFREALTNRADFNPYALFSYLAQSNSDISRKDLVQVLKENGITVTGRQLKLLLATHGHKDRLNFNSFLHFVLPSCLDALRNISTIALKKYNPARDGPLSEHPFCLFVLLLKHEIDFLQEFELLKRTLFPEVGRSTIQKLIRGIKKSNCAQ